MAAASRAESTTEEPPHTPARADSKNNCGLCQAIPGFLLHIQFGTGVKRSTRLRIERYIKNTLFSSEAQPDSSRSLAPARKRRRHEYESERERDDVDSRDSRVHAEDERQEHESQQHGLSITLYDQHAGFDLDTTGDDAIGARIDYDRGTNEIVGLGSKAMLELGNLCFNCSMPGHELRNCPMPPDSERIEANKRAFMEKGPGPFNGRLYTSIEDDKHTEHMRQKYAPGQPLSSELREALGLESDTQVPAYIESMYIFGYPPAYLGKDEKQQPLLVRAERLPPAPPTPVLHVYNDPGDYIDDAGDIDDTDHRTQIEEPSSPIQKVDSQVAVEENGSADSDEEGAISDGELQSPVAIAETDSKNESDSKPGTNGKITDKAIYNIPLVHYPGLDLSEFDFSSTATPGRPLHPHTPYRSSHSTGTRNTQNEGYNDSPVYESRSNRRHHQRYERDSRGTGYQDERGDWADMLDGYYESRHGRESYSDRRYNDRRNHDSYGDRDYNHPRYSRDSYTDRYYEDQNYISSSDTRTGSRYGNTDYGHYDHQRAPYAEDRYSSTARSYSQQQQQPYPPPTLPPLPADISMPIAHSYVAPNGYTEPSSGTTEPISQRPPISTDHLNHKNANGNGNGNGNDTSTEDGECDMEESD
ncbi:hypothetical protein GGI07_003308 [Coemansia sp. Benny D115]|nr:hypothetical protein GGI07_003308 [Coemansia sp. Benny D115]